MKGQWFIISAVVASSIFFTVSVLLKDYFVVDSSHEAAISNDYYFYDIVEQFNYIVATTPTNVSCSNLTARLDELKAVAERTLSPKGMFVFLNYTLPPSCSESNYVSMNLLIASEKEIIYNISSGATPGQIIGAS
jgi:hypothetical protein